MIPKQRVRLAAAKPPQPGRNGFASRACGLFFSSFPRFPGFFDFFDFFDSPGHCGDIFRRSPPAFLSGRRSGARVLRCLAPRFPGLNGRRAARPTLSSLASVCLGALLGLAGRGGRRAFHIKRSTKGSKSSGRSMRASGFQSSFLSSSLM